MLAVLVTLFGLLLSVALWWLRRIFTFWNGKGIAHLTFWEYVRFAYDIYTKPLNDVARRAYIRHGRVYGSYQGTVPTLVVGDADILREILVTKFKNFSDRSLSQTVGSDVWKKSIMNLSGDEWKKARAIFTRALTPSKFKMILAKIKPIAGRMTSRVIDAAAEKKPVNFSELASNVAFDTAAALNYSVDTYSEVDKDHTIMKCLENIAMGPSGWRIVMMFLMPTLYKALQPDYPPKSSTDVFKAFVSHVIEDRKSKNKEEDDFLQVFMNADYNWEYDAAKKSERSEIKKMSLDGMTAQIILFFMAGVDSVSNALAVTAYYLALNPESQDKVIAEVDKALAKGGLTYNSLQEVQYLDACIKEAMRLCIPDSILLRVCTEETMVAGIHFKPGMCVEIPVAGMHYDSEYFPEPKNFNPDRFMPENKDSIRPFTYMPFGAGPRNCVGMRLGFLQVKATLACLLQHVRLETCPETMIPLKFKSGQFLLNFDGPLLLQAVPRNHSGKNASC
ncbi:cytochrome P450 3A41-like isoform X1 [Rhipicephalus microplus]|uniref:cytochrome P450 3A41-like isoform X1 n=1 Tax=Rhipicephalus microplus TaxID=6941 RepID=UPI003F6B73BE